MHDLVERTVTAVKPGSIVPVRIGIPEGGREDYFYNELPLLHQRAPGRRIRDRARFSPDEARRIGATIATSRHRGSGGTMLADRFRLSSEALDYSVSAEDATRLDGGAWGDAVIGQPRALEALAIGTAIRAKGYNIFVSGAPGTGRRTAVMRTLSAYKPPRLELARRRLRVQLQGARWRRPPCTSRRARQSFSGKTCTRSSRT
ncbi:MAG: AAA family ATPase [Candidatus Moduliflexus flocculans]|nr:AAA family ATPase [Candidatus Moduliflexus flocculans]